MDLRAYGLIIRFIITTHRLRGGRINAKMLICLPIALLGVREVRERPFSALLEILPMFYRDLSGPSVAAPLR